MAMGFTTRESARQVLEAYESDDDVARGKLRMLHLSLSLLQRQGIDSTRGDFVIAFKELGR